MDDVVAGTEYALKDASDRECKAVLTNLSLGGGRREAMNDAAAAIVKKGYFMAAAAGHATKDAADFCPASEPSVCTVGATDSSDNKIRFTNFGPVVDIHAPGVQIMSTIPGGETVCYCSLAILNNTNK